MIRPKIISTLQTCVPNVSKIIYRKMSDSMLESVRNSIPQLDNSSHKGQAGRIGIVGGSLEYTGAPYFAGISALKVGADLVHIFCASSAAVVIKTYSPELIVHPLLDRENAVVEITPWLDRLHAIVIGPGLGRESDTLIVVSKLIAVIKEKKIPLVIDADGLHLITEKPELIQDFLSPVILTPNKIEYERLSKKARCLCDLRKWGGNNILVLKKGASDELKSSVSLVQWKLSEGGSGRRCGGQGDLLSGSIATFLNWMLSNKEKIEYSTWGEMDAVEQQLVDSDKKPAAASLACYAASVLVRKCNEKAFKLKGRSMLASDMIEHIHESFEEIFGQ